jgi:hypothetical protein
MPDSHRHVGEGRGARAQGHGAVCHCCPALNPNDAVPVYLAEYQSLRSEALTHFTFANALIGLQVAAIGVGITVVRSLPVLAAGLAALTSVIWLSYLDHITSIHRIALYVGTELRYRLESATGKPCLEWEHWLRGLRSTGVQLSTTMDRVEERGTEPRLGLTYPSWFFGGTATLLLAYFFYKCIRYHGADPVWQWLALVAAACLVTFSAVQTSRVGLLMRNVDLAHQIGRSVNQSADGQAETEPGH